MAYSKMRSTCAGKTCICLLCWFFMLSAITACEAGMVNEERSAASEIDFEEKIRVLAGKKIYFGHQSVGMNIIDGMIRLSSEQNNADLLHYVKINKTTDLTGAGFFHSLIGSNDDPESKIRDFEKIVNDTLEGNVDIAFMKFCYLDIDPYTDIDTLFNEYQRTLASLKEKYPGVVFVHVTVPLKSLQRGPKAWLKRLLGKPVVGYEDNANRERYNAKMREAYLGQEPLFDLAGVESRYPSGELARVSMKDKQIPYLVSEYTDDGGHLNEKGQRVAARHLISMLANVISQ